MSQPDETDPAEFAKLQLRPLRIQKRLEPKLEPKQKPDEFVCRPMRLRLNPPSSDEVMRQTDLESRHSARNSSSNTESLKTGSQVSESEASSQHSGSGAPPIHIKNLPLDPKPKQVRDSNEDPVFAICVVDFHHVRGPEVQWWRSNYHKLLDGNTDLFKNLPFQALPDGAHLFEETFSNFNLVYDFARHVSLDNQADIDAFDGNPNHLETLFGCSCVRQVKTQDLSPEELERNRDITRSMVQKALVVISRKQPVFTKIKEKLSIITHSFFQQDSFANFDLLDSLFDNLNESLHADHQKATSLLSSPKKPEDLVDYQHNQEQEEYFVNLNLLDILALYGNNLLVILKALILEKKVLIFSNSNLELLTQFQNNLIALIPNLINNLELSGSPLCDYTEKHLPLEKPTSLRTNDRLSMLRFFGLPLQIFNTKGSFWNPYLPLPQLEELNADTVMAGCSNLLIVNQAAHYKFDILVNLDTSEVTFPQGRPEDLRLSTLDKKFISVLLAKNKSAEGYFGSDDYIRYEFEDYVRSLLATTRFHQYKEKFNLPPPGFDTLVDKSLGVLKAFNDEFIKSWFATKNYKVWNAICDELIFNFFHPAHLGSQMTAEAVPYNLGGIFGSLRKTQGPAKTQTTFSHNQKPHKFIEDTDKEDSSAEPESKDARGWTWGFKR